MVLMNALPFWIVSFVVFALVAAAILVVGFQLKKKNPESRVLSVYLCFVLFLAFFTRFLGYNYPFNTFWDENYHVASAQKYIDHVMFMEPHPPLGKMIIALGEWMIHPNAAIDTTPFLTTDYIRDFPAGYSFLGVRFLPTLLATLSVLVFFLILYRLSRNAHYSFLFSFFYIFENSMILHTRSAMLEGPQFFFMLVAILYFIVLFQKKDLVKKIEYFYLGILIGLAVSVKVNSLILALVYPVIAWKDHWPEVKAMDWRSFFQDRKEMLRRSGKLLGVIALKAAAAVGGIAAVFCLAYYIHFALGEKVLQNRTYRASADYIQVLKSYQTANPVNFPLLFGESLEFTRHYEKGVPLWDPTKKDENGSPAFTWPVGYKSINYRWEKSMGKTAYFYYQGNPVIWFAGLFAVIIALGLVLARAVFGFVVKDTQKLTMLGFFTFLYFLYMAVMSQIDRVLYLYHYLMPLIFAMIALYLLFLILFEELVRVTDKMLYYTVSLIALEVFAAFLFFSPFTYGIPLAASDFVKRAWMRVWDLKYLFF